MCEQEGCERHRWVASVPSGAARVSQQLAAATLPRPLLAPAKPTAPLPHHLRTHPPRLFLALSLQQHTAKETDRARMTAPLSSEAPTAMREPVPEGCAAAAGREWRR